MISKRSRGLKPGSEVSAAQVGPGPVGVVLLCLGLLAPLPAEADTVDGEIDGYRYRLFVPEASPGAVARPLLVVLHGCRQSAEDMVRLSGFDALARTQDLAVLYPQTAPSAKNPYGCWQWWLPENQLRAGGEPEIVVKMVAEAASATAVDRDRVYAAGFSSGGAMSAILGALYPDVFAAVGAHSGIPYAAAGDGSCALRAMSDGTSAVESRAAVAYHARGKVQRPMPLMVIQGELDEVVAADNATGLIRQFAQLNDFADDGDGANQSVDAEADASREDRVGDGKAFRISIYHDARGVEIMRDVRVAGLGHAWSGGPADAAFSDPRGPDAASLFWSFFKHRTLKDPPPRKAKTATCRERYGSNFAHYWWHRRISREEYRCDPWGWTWRRGFDGEWAAGRCP